ncbi:unnamed protein product [Bursaphelenchus okinawaensis]|uniref:GH18 domain-containing protein n=1 Tax=Bursaphelenchus okinawaensis TaxID=465554 RepID=A0A811KMG3_9BILA|nr:unnamed protein product [Bursaphelenchus okinawaensis]CAG9107692.1 unnamed protein product [Bursaphelenchus okinawaensis]
MISNSIVSAILFLFCLLIQYTKATLISCYAKHMNPRPEMIDPYLCTHILLIGSTNFGGDGPTFPPIEEIRRYNKLKTVNHRLKVLISLTPNNPAMTAVTSNEIQLAQYVAQVKDYLLANDVDGFDIDWEFPVFSPDAKPSDRDGFSLLLKALREEFDKTGQKLILSVALGAPYTVLERSYDINALNLYVDLVQIMNYDYHIYNPVTTPFVGFNAPLRKLPYEIFLLDRLNSEYSTQNYLNKGLDRNKLIFGIPTYGRGFKLLTELLHFPYSPAVGVSALGEYIPYRRSCKYQLSNQFSYVWEDGAASPYLYQGREWLSVEDERSVRLKAEFARDLGVAGVMIFAIDSDDYDAKCSNKTFPLIKSIRSVFKTDEEVEKMRVEDTKFDRNDVILDKMEKFEVDILKESPVTVLATKEKAKEAAKLPEDSIVNDVHVQKHVEIDTNYPTALGNDNKLGQDGTKKNPQNLGNLLDTIIGFKLDDKDPESKVETDQIRSNVTSKQTAKTNSNENLNEVNVASKEAQDHNQHLKTNIQTPVHHHHQKRPKVSDTVSSILAKQKEANNFDVVEFKKLRKRRRRHNKKWRDHFIVVG